MKALLFLLFIGTLFCACRPEVISDPLVELDYVIENKSSSSLEVVGLTRYGDSISVEVPNLDAVLVEKISVFGTDVCSLEEEEELELLSIESVLRQSDQAPLKFDPNITENWTCEVLTSNTGKLVLKIDDADFD